MKKGILLVTFGTSMPVARVAFDNIDRLARSRFTDTEIRWAYTSSTIRRKLARSGIQLDSPLIALARMHEEGYTHVAVQSLHVAAGAEYHDLARTVAAFRTGPNAFDRVTLGKPLLVRHADLEAVVEAVLAALPDRGEDDALVLMGHGNEHGRGDMTFLAAAAAFRNADPRAFLGTVAGQPTRDDVLRQLRQCAPRRVFLVPFMSVAGDHARNDLAGSEDDSWRSVIAAMGIECVPVLKGIAEYDGVVAVWLAHLATALRELDDERGGARALDAIQDRK